LFEKKSVISLDFLDGVFLTNSGAKIQLLAPLENAASDTAPAFNWSGINGFTDYFVEMSKNSNFVPLALKARVSGQAYAFSSGDLLIGTTLESTRYYWRIRSINESNTQYSVTRSLHVRSKTVSYVNSESTSSFQYGNQSAPFKSIQAAIEDAKATGKSEVYVAKGSYNESLVMRPGVALRGGYDAATWQRNITQNASIIVSNSDVAVKAGADITAAYASTTLLDGFTINATGTGSLNAIYIHQGHLTIQNNTLNVNQTGAPAGEATGIVGISSSPTISKNTISISSAAGTTVRAYGIKLSFSTGTISANLISLNVNTDYPEGIQISNATSMTVTQNAIVVVAPSATAARGIYIGANANPSVKNNSISGTTGTQFQSIVIEGNGNSPSIENNIIFPQSGTTRIGVFEAAAGTNDPATFLNNLIFSTVTSLYRDEGSAVTDRTTQGALTVGNTTLAGPCSGNLAPWNIMAGPYTANVFASGFSLTSLKTWVILPNGPADLDLSGGWSTGDIGADVANAGAP